MRPLAATAYRPVASLPFAGVHPAARLAAGILLVATVLVAPARGLPIVLVVEGIALARAGYLWRHLGTALRPWLWLIALVLLVHILTTLDAAPLGHPSWTGFLRGVVTLTRLAGMAVAVALVRRLVPLPELASALAWWLRPLRCDVSHVALVLAVALGTAGRVLDDGRRVRAALRLRRGGARGPAWRDAMAAAVPALESLLRRAETLPLALHGRVVRPVRATPLPWWQGAGLVVWLAALVVVAR